MSRNPEVTPGRASVRIVTRPLWRIRLASQLPRYLLYAVCVAGLAASARFAIDPPRAGGRPPAATPAAVGVLAGRGFASLFARRYLTWNAGEGGQAGGTVLGPLTDATGAESGAAVRLPNRGEQHVEWAEVVQERQPSPREHVYTVAAQTDSSGLLYLSVSIVRTGDGALALGGYPAFVGPPAWSPSMTQGASREVEDPALKVVVERVLRNYLAASAYELAADLTSGARVSLPPRPLVLQSIGHVDWAPGGHAVLATVQAEDAHGVLYTLEYELDVSDEQGRWGVSAVQMDPDA